MESLVARLRKPAAGVLGGDAEEADGGFVGGEADEAERGVVEENAVRSIIGGEADVRDIVGEADEAAATKPQASLAERPMRPNADS